MTQRLRGRLAWVPKARNLLKRQRSAEATIVWKGFLAITFFSSGYKGYEEFGQEMSRGVN